MEKYKKIDMYQQVPEEFRIRLRDTLDHLGEEPKRTAFRGKRFAAIAAASLVACTGLTVGAAGLFDWHPSASERFGTDREMENRLSAQGAALKEEGVSQDSDVTLEAVQTVRTDTGYYFLFSMELPEGFVWNDDMVIEETRLEGIPEEDCLGCAANFAGEPDGQNRIPVEMQVRMDGEAALGDQVTVALKNVAQCGKADYVETVIEGEWELSLFLPQEADALVWEKEERLEVGEHELMISRVELSPFQIRLYTDEASARHATAFAPALLTGVEYSDGSVIENTVSLATGYAKAEDGTFFIGLNLGNVIDPKKAEALRFLCGGEETALPLDGLKNASQGSPEKNATETSEKLSEVLRENGGAELVSELSIVDVEDGKAILADQDHLYLWDVACDRAQCLITLSKYGYSLEDGGEFVMEYGGDTLMIHPAADSDHVVLLRPAAEEGSWKIWESAAENLWPYPYRDLWEERICDVETLVPDAGADYSAKAVFSKGQWYALYSGDGTAAKTELILIKD